MIDSKTPTMPKFMILETQLVSAIGLYLLNRPMGEVEHLVNAMRNAQQYNPPAQAETESGPEQP